MLSADPNFSTLVQAVQAAGLVETLNAAGPFTVFAPTNEAFAKLPPAQLQALLADPAALRRVLTFHVVAGRLPAAQLAGQTLLTTAAGPTVTVAAGTSGSLTVGGATVTRADIAASNGVVHAIDAVLIPPGS